MRAEDLGRSLAVNHNILGSNALAAHLRCTQFTYLDTMARVGDATLTAE
jgi:hypothetical protein